MEFSEASLKPSSDEKYFRYFISCYFSDLNGGCEACVCISVMYCGLRGLSIFQSQLLQTIISCFVQLKRLQRTRTRGFGTKGPHYSLCLYCLWHEGDNAQREIITRKAFWGLWVSRPENLWHWRPASYNSHFSLKFNECCISKQSPEMFMFKKCSWWNISYKDPVIINNWTNKLLITQLSS